MEKQSRKRVVLKLGAAFAVGLLVFILQFGAAAVWEWLYMFAVPFGLGRHVFRDGVFVSWYGLAVLMLASIGVSIWSRRLLWISYILIAVYWLYTYAFLTLSF
jgi:hypothetical protein